jgi:hypothetical protein
MSKTIPYFIKLKGTRPITQFSRNERKVPVNVKTLERGEREIFVKWQTENSFNAKSSLRILNYLLEGCGGGSWMGLIIVSDRKPWEEEREKIE